MNSVGITLQIAALSNTHELLARYSVALLPSDPSPEVFFFRKQDRSKKESV